MMRVTRQSSRYWFEPFIWLFYCFFQPTRFKSEFEIKGLLNFKRTIPIFRLMPVFFSLYTFLALVRIILTSCFPDFFSFPLDGSVVLGLIVAIAGGLVLGVVGNLTLGIIGSFVLDIVIATTLGVHLGQVRAEIFALVAGLLFGLVESSELSLMAFAIGGLTLGIAEGVLASITGCIALSTAGVIMLFFIRQSRKYVGVFIGGVIGTLVWFVSEKTFINGSIDEIISYFSGTIFIVSYMLGYYRIPLYLISGSSSLRSYLASRKDPSQVFIYLSRSSLYWDECVFLPLPKLKELLLLAYERDSHQGLDVLDFVVHEKPQQAILAQSAALEILLRNLESCATLDDIAQASHLLVRFLSPDAQLIAPRDSDFLRLFNAASAEVIRFFNWPNRRSRRDALETMQASLKMLHSKILSRDIDSVRRLTQLTKRWLDICEAGLTLERQDAEESGSIHNPYAPGPVLKPGNHLFVGRRDLAFQLEAALEKGIYRPTFFLFGERRMGKSSTLHHLPNLLGSRYIPIFYDLQSPGMLASTVTLLGAITQEIYEEVSARGIKIKELPSTKLRDANQKSEAQIYYEVDEWLKELELILKQEDRTLLLTFDEFEYLEDAEQGKNLNIKFLLSWFRSIIQYRPRVSLLFSGVHTASDMKLDWAGYFVNVQALKVSFLNVEDAYQLITQPAPDFPGEQIFDKDAAEEIMRITGCHPFLIQAVCSVLINYINSQERNRVKKQDLDFAIDQVLTDWGTSYFQDLWNRMDDTQQVCFMALVGSDTTSISQIEQRSGLTREVVYKTLKKLVNRDLVTMRQDTYCITVPILSTWVGDQKRHLFHL